MRMGQAPGMKQVAGAATGSGAGLIHFTRGSLFSYEPAAFTCVIRRGFAA
ncbi:hypothetical protein [Acetobacter oeni]|nr:hypothetical protein [Acetobacter oeni]MBB3882497.1 hypothetical protein [Acetobacter oeni]NHO18691.1 hypothetical protein [Acetobacter oeni]GBR11772.1 hypothetical protein AA21952_3447 [Acetobacter oeni LMG 21952]